jgi:hypothetical protein
VAVGDRNGADLARCPGWVLSLGSFQAAETVLVEAIPSVLGRRFLNTTRDHLETWAAEPFPDDVRAAAERLLVQRVRGDCSPATCFPTPCTHTIQPTRPSPLGLTRG